MRTSSTIQVSYDGFSPSAQAAFQAAVDVWQSLIVSDQVIHVDAHWVTLPSGVLGSAGPNQIYLENDHRWYPGALHEARCHCNDETTEAEIDANFNKSFSSWYLGTDGNTPNNKWDLETVVLHELGHGLGFLSSFQLGIDNKVHWGFGTTHPMRFDTNEWDSKTTGHTIVAQYANGSAALKTQVTDGSVFLGGMHVEAVLGGRAKLFAPNPWQSGSSNSHFDEGKFAPGTANALMTPVLNDGESIHNPGPATIAVFQDIGWSVAGSGSDDVTAPVVDAPTVSIKANQQMGAAVTVRVGWPDATDDSGIASYELQRQAGAGTWTPITLMTQTSTFADVSVTRGSNYSFRVRATDGAGNTGNWTTTSSAHMSTAQETAGSIGYTGSWSVSSVSGAAGGQVEQSVVVDSAAWFSFTGTSVAFVSTKAPARGVAELFLDSVSVGTVDLFADSKQAKRIVWSSGPLSPGSHSLTVQVTGDTSGTSDRIDVDAFLTWP